MLSVVAAIAPQVDRLNVVLNEYGEAPPALANHSNVVVLLPPEDLKDTGKFLPETSEKDWVFLIDDDIAYPTDYVSRSLRRAQSFDDGATIFGYHGSIYEKPRLAPSWKAIRRKLSYRPEYAQSYRRNQTFYRKLEHPLIVDQLGTGLAFARHRNLPDFSYMRGSATFVDVRYARWCHEQSARMVCLPRAENWLTPIRHEDSIFEQFTKQHRQNVAQEVLSFAYRRAEVGTYLEPSPSD